MSEEKPDSECEWKRDDDGLCKAECGDVFVFEDGGPTDNGFKFCPYCGKPLHESPGELTPPFLRGRKMEPKPVRLQRRRTKGFRLVSPNGLPIVFVTRPGKWGNPFLGKKHGAKWAVNMFSLLMQRKQSKLIRRLQKVGVTEAVAVLTVTQIQLNAGHQMQTHLHELRGKNLACYCSPNDVCHADVLLALANEPDRV